jgi:cobalt-zinc-cadmium efflux system membrane fusion protein
MDPPVGADKPVCITDSMSAIIRIDTARLGNIGSELKLSGEIGFDDKKVTRVFPFSSGQVIKVNVSTGDKVHRGQTLAIIKSAEVSGNYSDLSTAGNDVAIAKKQMENQESLYKNGIASEKEYIEARENYLKARTSAAKMENMIRINGGGHTNATGTYSITAPIDGYVLEKKINQGTFIRTDAADNLFTIGNIGDVWVLANVYETDISKVKAGYAADITTLAYSDSTFHGVVDEVSNILDPITKVMRIRIKLPNRQQLLKPEMFANVTIYNKEGAKAISISSQSIISENGKNYVILYRGKCSLSVREVEILKTSGNQTFLSSGLQSGDQVIANNQILFFKALTEK